MIRKVALAGVAAVAIGAVAVPAYAADLPPMAPVAPAPAANPPLSLEELEEDDRQLLPVTSEVVGLFHQSASNPAEPLVRQGDQIKAGQVVGFVESMNLNHEVRATQGGTVVEVIAREGEPVEYGQALMLLALEA